MPKQRSIEAPLADDDQQFKTSRELKRLFSRLVEEWKQKHRLGLDDLAQRCGVTPSYLGHVGRYGRIPGKPVLILLAFNFDMESPEELLRAAHVLDPWPFDRELRLRPPGFDSGGLLSIRLDMNGLTQAVREIVRTEVRPRSVRDLTRGAPLRVGLNLGQSVFFQRLSAEESTKRKFDGLFPRLFDQLAVALQNDCTFEAIHYEEALERMQRGELDLYGPIATTPKRFGKAIYMEPFCLLGMSALMRLRPASELAQLPSPRSREELRTGEYQIAVLRESNSHHFCLSDLQIPVERLVLCDTPDEVVERTVMGGIRRPAHLMVCDSWLVEQIAATRSKDLKPLFTTPSTWLGRIEDSIAIRPDWPELLGVVNEALRYARKHDSLRALYELYGAPELKTGVDLLLT